MENVINYSPVQSPKEEVLMTFSQAIAEVAKGKKITKLEWADNQFYGVLKDGRLMLHKPDGNFYQWILSDGDILGDDWILTK